MAANVFVFLFSGLLVGLLYYFKLRRASTKAEVGRLALVLAFNGDLAILSACEVDIKKK